MFVIVKSLGRDILDQNFMAKTSLEGLQVIIHDAVLFFKSLTLIKVEYNIIFLLSQCWALVS